MQSCICKVEDDDFQGKTYIIFKVSAKSIIFHCDLSTQYMPGTICKPKTSEYVMIKNVYFYIT